MFMQGAQQIVSGSFQIKEGQRMIDEAKRPVPTPSTGGFNAPYSTDPATGAVVAGGGGTAITGDGSDPSTPDHLAATLGTDPPPGLGDPINPNPLPSGPPRELEPGQFNVGNNQDQGGQGGGGGGMGGESTAPADMSQLGASYPTEAPQGVAGANYESSGALPQGGGGGGRGGTQDNGDINLNSALGALLAGMKKDEPDGPKTDIRFFGGGDQNMSAIPYTPYGKDADLMRRVSDRIRFEHQTGRVGG